MSPVNIRKHTKVPSDEPKNLGGERRKKNRDCPTGRCSPQVGTVPIFQINGIDIEVECSCGPSLWSELVERKNNLTNLTRLELFKTYVNC